MSFPGQAILLALSYQVNRQACPKVSHHQDLLSGHISQIVHLFVASKRSEDKRGQLHRRRPQIHHQARENGHIFTLALSLVFLPSIQAFLTICLDGRCLQSRPSHCLNKFHFSSKMCYYELLTYACGCKPTARYIQGCSASRRQFMRIYYEPNRPDLLPFEWSDRCSTVSTLR